MEYNFGSHDSKQVGRHIREQPPRDISLYSKMVILFGGVMQQMGWAFFGFGMIFFWVFVMNSEARYLLSFDGKWVETQGVLKNVSRTNSSVNDQPIYAYTFSYETKDGMKESVCYDTYAPEYQRPNNNVPVLYKSGNPKRAKIRGMSTSTFPVFVIFVIIFPLLGLGFLISGLVSNLKSLKLLVNGHFTKGKIVNKVATNTRINNNTVYKYTFEFDIDGMKQQCTSSTHQTWKVEDEEQEIILYNPYNPQNAVVYDTIPGAPEIDPMGHLEPASLSAVSVFILPVISIFVNLLLFYIFVVLGISI